MSGDANYTGLLAIGRALPQLPAIVAADAYATEASDPAEVARLLPVTQWAVAELAPHSWLHVADTLTGLLNRAPFNDSQRWTAERLILGCLATELRQAAIERGEPATEPDAGTLWVERQLWPDERTHGRS